MNSCTFYLSVEVLFNATGLSHRKGVNDIDAKPMSMRVTWFLLLEDLHLASPSQDALLAAISAVLLP